MSRMDLHSLQLFSESLLHTRVSRSSSRSESLVGSRLRRREKYCYSDLRTRFPYSSTRLVMFHGRWSTRLTGAVTGLFQARRLWPFSSMFVALRFRTRLLGRSSSRTVPRSSTKFSTRSGGFKEPQNLSVAKGASRSGEEAGRCFR